MLSLSALPLAAVLTTAVDKEGQLKGTDLELMGELALASRHPLQASGGISSLDELRSLRARGVAAAVLGMALYQGALEASAVAQEFI
jgi:phosphoribosylformimino-5-aminoimidazole carboxamide ribonucleotide (ProFAR) isomerase